MVSLNKVQLIGNLTKDPELRYTPAGTAVANIRIGVSRKYKDRSGELKEDTCFVNVISRDKQAEACVKYLQKGRPVLVEGLLQSRSWDAPDGQKRNIIEVRAERIQFLNFSAPGPAGTGVAGEAPDSHAVESVGRSSEAVHGTDDAVWEE